YRLKYIMMALEELVVNKIPILDRYGYTTYLREDDGTFYLDRSYPVYDVQDKPSYAMALYSNGINALESENLADIVVSLQKNEQEIIVEEMEGYEPGSEEFNDELAKLNVENKAGLLENVLMRYINGED